MASHKKRVESLEGREDEGGAPIVVARPGESKEAAMARHLAEHPEDEDKVMILIYRSSAPRDPKGEASGAANSTSGPDKTVRPLQITR